MSVKSAWMPPSRRKVSMPARSVTTWKFTARRPRAMAKRTALATIQPAMRMITARNSRGSRSPTWARNTRSGSTIGSKLFIAGLPVLSLVFQHSREPRERDVDPVRAVAHLVAQLVERLLQLGEREQPAHVGEALVEAAFRRRRGVGVEERLARLRFPFR